MHLRYIVMRFIPYPVFSDIEVFYLALEKNRLGYTLECQVLPSAIMLISIQYLKAFYRRSSDDY